MGYMTFTTSKVNKGIIIQNAAEDTASPANLWVYVQNVGTSSILFSTSTVPFGIYVNGVQVTGATITPSGLSSTTYGSLPAGSTATFELLGTGAGNWRTNLPTTLPTMITIKIVADDGTSTQYQQQITT
jgi:archaellum component FlaG (FlaF/FlaG flagellin family)